MARPTGDGKEPRYPDAAEPIGSPGDAQRQSLEELSAWASASDAPYLASPNAGRPGGNRTLYRRLRGARHNDAKLTRQGIPRPANVRRYALEHRAVSDAPEPPCSARVEPHRTAPRRAIDPAVADGLSELNDVTVEIGYVRERLIWGVLAAFDYPAACINHSCDRVVEL